MIPFFVINPQRFILTKKPKEQHTSYPLMTIDSPAFQPRQTLVEVRVHRNYRPGHQTVVHGLA